MSLIDHMQATDALAFMEATVDAKTAHAKGEQSPKARVGGHISTFCSNVGSYELRSFLVDLAGHAARFSEYVIGDQGWGVFAVAWDYEFAPWCLANLVIWDDESQIHPRVKDFTLELAADCFKAMTGADSPAHYRDRERERRNG